MMADSVSLGVKLFAAAGMSAAGGAAVADVMRHAERMILGVPQSVLMVSLAGALIGVLLLPGEEIKRVMPAAGLPAGKRSAQLAKRLSALALAVLAYALLAAWVVAVAGYFAPSLAGAPQLPLAGISGVVIRPMLPRYMQLVERITGAIGNKGAAE